MRKIRDVLRLSAAGMSKRKIAASLGVSATAAGDCIRRAGRAGVLWPLSEELTEETLELRLYPPPAVTGKDRRPRPDWAEVHGELRRPGVTLQLLWERARRKARAGSSGVVPCAAGASSADAGACLRGRAIVFRPVGQHHRSGSSGQTLSVLTPGEM